MKFTAPTGNPSLATGYDFRQHISITCPVQRQVDSPTIIMAQYFIRLGALGEIHLAESTETLTRGLRVVVRTNRGIELAEIVGRGPRENSTLTSLPIRVGAIDEDSAAFKTHRILRLTTQQDEMLARRLQRHKPAAIENCRRQLEAAGSTATLLDVDQSLDGRTLTMHFLGPVDDIAESITERVVSEYESSVRSRHLAKLLHDGCGPGCGEQDGQGCQSSCAIGACAGCGLATAKDRSL